MSGRMYLFLKCISHLLLPEPIMLHVNAENFNFYFTLKIFICLAVPGLSCVIQDL